MNLGFIKPRLLDDQEQTHCMEVAKSANSILRRMSEDVYGGVDLRKLRRDIIDKNILLKPSGQEAFTALDSITMPLLEGHICCAAKLARTFFRSKTTKASYSDFFQEANIALLDAIYFYDGSTKFITLATTAIRNRLLDYVRSLTLLTPPAQYILDLKQAVQQLISAGMLFDDAVKQLGLDENSILNVRRAMAEVTPCSQFKRHEEKSFDEMSISFDAENSSFDVKDAKEALAKANLTEFEAALFEAYLHSANADGFRSEIARQFNLTRAAAGLAFKRAITKVQRAYESISGHPLREAA